MILVAVAFSIQGGQAQLEFCSGNSGDPIFTETFGSGVANVQLPSGTTTYTYATSSPNDGYYTVSSNSAYFDWFDIVDHTANDTDGRMLIINADFTAGEFYRRTIDGLCENTSYEFSSWMINLLPSSGCGGAGIPINVKFEIWDSTDMNLLASGDTGSIPGTSSPNWEQYALLFQTLPAQTSVILKMRNNGVGGCGNDLALDDIVFKSCGDTVIIEDTIGNRSVHICEDDLPYSAELMAIPDYTVFSTHFYQWQSSNDGTTWMDIVGETNQNYVTPSLSSTIYYRVLVAEAPVNVTNPFCNSSSEIFTVEIIPSPNEPLSNGNLIRCENDMTPLSVTVGSDVTVNWFDAPVGGNLLQSNSLTFYPNAISGTYYAESETLLGQCVSNGRTAIRIDYVEAPRVANEVLEFCENTSLVIHADTNISTATYLWSTGDTTEQITVSTPGTYSVEVSNGACTVIKTVDLNQIDNPVIDQVSSIGNDIIVSATNTGDFLYSLDGNTYQSNNTFFNVKGGLYTIYIRERNCQEVVAMSYLHFYIPRFFTPNNDGINDTFNLAGIEFYDDSKVSIFDRYGKLLKNAGKGPFEWNGTYAGALLPADDYWYVVIIEGQKFTGHFTLKR
ncbi:T9SS type B sorting domain-containing protein [Aestuariivivens sediminis]|uniref:T9SS type B sorting domain-containing protein n=1 Tax=Aestuariivivens sediminis TaxID=2913557 RepID=UPI001F570675|nr:T9SS type B sorting domain-containing protein [Aestuariivivens sediminis]